MSGGDHGGGADVDDDGPGKPDDQQPEQFGPYRLLELLGRGGMGEVWRAFDTRRERTVALKRLTGSWATVPAFQERFRLEARTTARLESEHVIVIHDYGEIDGRLYIDMRLVGGGDLGQLLASHPYGLGPAQASDLCSQIADGLDAAHRQGLVHRDVKPSNVLLVPDGARQRAYLVDFGIAKLADEVTGAGLTATGTTLGTPAYMAPELYDAAGAASAASDTYALGCVLFEMLTGRRVFAGSTSASLMAAHLYERPPPPSTIRPELAGFDPILARALAKAPGQRQPSAGALGREAVQVAWSGGIPVPPQPPPYAGGPPGGRPMGPGGPGFGPPPSARPGTPGNASGSRSWWGRHRALLLGLAALVVVLVVAAGLLVARPWEHGSTDRPVATAVAPTPPGPPQLLAVPLPNPTALTFSPDGRLAYVVDGTNNAVTVVDTTAGAATATIPVGVNPMRVALSPDGSRAYVANTGTDQAPGTTVTVIDTATRAAVATIPVGSGPLDVVVSPDGRRAWVSNTGTGDNPGSSLSVIDTATNTVVGTIPVGAGPARMGLSPDGRQLWVPNAGSASTAGTTVTVVDTATNATSTVTVGSYTPQMATISPDGRRVYVLCGGSSNGVKGSVQVIDPVSRTVVPLNGGGPIEAPFEQGLSPDGRTLVVPETGVQETPGRTVWIIDTLTGSRRDVSLTARPFGVAVTPDGTAAWVAAYSPGQLWRIPLRAG